MTHPEIRQKFIDFFKEKKHILVPSSSLLSNDPSVLFTTAGMQQFKPYYTGEADPLKDFGSKNTVSIQKCIRTSDVDEVGDESHLTFFEMLGNFSFGGYGKKEAIEYAYEFITKEMGLKIDYVTIFEGNKDVSADLESEKIWQSVSPNIKIEKRGFEENFWGPTGDGGPCGPTTEIYINGVEIWNIVFNEYYCAKDLKFQPLDTKGIDTGMGLERLLMVVQKTSNIFETDIFKPLLELIRHKILNPLKGENSYRIIIDHLRASILLISGGLRPGKKDKEYTLRRLIRRATMHAMLFPRNTNNVPELEKVMTTPHLYQEGFEQVVMDIFDYLEKVYPELKNKRGDIESVLHDEITNFSFKIRDGQELYFGFGKNISGKEAFLLKQSYGFPIELTRELAKMDGKEINEIEFKEEEEKHQKISRVGTEKKFGGHGLLLDTGEIKAATEKEIKIVTRLHTATHLLHAALRKILGEEVKQAGSDITAERLRFDFTFPRKLTTEEIKKVENLINEVTNQDLPVTKEEMPHEEAVKTGALSFFKQKYPPVVNVYSVGDFSKELCGGPHVSHTEEIGHFKITKEEAVSAGTRRIRAVVK